MSLYHSKTREVWAAIHPTHGLVCGICDIEHFTFAQAVRLHRPLEVRRMSVDEAHDSMGKFLAIKKGASDGNMTTTIREEDKTRRWLRKTDIKEEGGTEQ